MTPNQYPPGYVDPNYYNQGYPPYNNDDPYPSIFTKQTPDEVRMGFIRKVYSIVTFQLVLTVVFSLIVYNNKQVKDFLVHQIWIFITALVLNIITVYALFCCKSNARTVPRNYILLTIFTLTEALFVSAITAMADPGIVLLALVLTAAMFIGLTSYALITKTDFTMCGGFLFVLCCITLTATIFNIFMGSRILETVIAGVSLALYSLYLIYDTQLIVGGKEQELQIDDYILGSIMIYIDIIQIFIRILQILQAINN